MSRIPSAWEKNDGDSHAVAYWKYRVRRMENFAFALFISGIIFGMMLTAFARWMIDFPVDNTCETSYSIIVTPDEESKDD
jgi:hypothetical protein